MSENLEKRARRIAVAITYRYEDYWVFKCPVCKMKTGYDNSYSYEEVVEKAKNHILNHLRGR